MLPDGAVPFGPDVISLRLFSSGSSKESIFKRNFKIFSLTCKDSRNVLSLTAEELTVTIFSSEQKKESRSGTKRINFNFKSYFVVRPPFVKTSNKSVLSHFLSISMN